MQSVLNTIIIDIKENNENKKTNYYSCQFETIAI